MDWISKVLDRISIGTLMLLCFILALLYLLTPNPWQVYLDNIHLPFLPVGTFKFLVFLPISYFLTFILKTFIYELKATKKAWLDADKERRKFDWIDELNQEELKIVDKLNNLSTIEYQYYYLEIENPAVKSLTLKGIITPCEEHGFSRHYSLLPNRKQQYEIYRLFH